MNLTKIYAYFALTAAFTYPAISQAVTWTGALSGGDWLDSDNWDTLPVAGNSVTLSGATIEVNGAGATYGFFANSAGTININSGGILTQTGTNASSLRYITKININSGGTFITNPGVNLRTNLDIASGGTLEGTTRVRDGKRLNVDGIFRPGDSLSVTEYLIDTGTIDLTSNGSIELDIFGNSSGGSTSNDHFTVTSSTLNVSTGTIKLTPQGYTPSIGDSWDLWDGDGITLGASIVLDGYDLDLSQLASGLVTVSGITGVPEPSTYAMILGLSAFGMLFIRRRCR